MHDAQPLIASAVDVAKKPVTTDSHPGLVLVIDKLAYY